MGIFSEIFEEWEKENYEEFFDEPESAYENPPFDIEDEGNEIDELASNIISKIIDSKKLSFIDDIKLNPRVQFRNQEFIMKYESLCDKFLKSKTVFIETSISNSLRKYELDFLKEQEKKHEDFIFELIHNDYVTFTRWLIHLLDLAYKDQILIAALNEFHLKDLLVIFFNNRKDHSELFQTFIKEALRYFLEKTTDMRNVKIIEVLIESLNFHELNLINEEYFEDSEIDSYAREYIKILEKLYNVYSRNQELIALDVKNDKEVKTNLFNSVRTFKFNESVEKLEILYNSLIDRGIIECSFDKFNYAFSGEKLEKPLNIKWLLKGKNKRINKASLFYFIDYLQLHNLIQFDSIFLYKIINKCFVDANGDEISGLKQSRYSSLKKPMQGDLIEKIVKQIL